MKRPVIHFLMFLLISLSAQAIYAQEAEAAREKTKTRLNGLLQREGPALQVTFRPSERNAFNFLGEMRTGLKNAEKLEIVISVTSKETISFRIFPHYRGGYINIDKVRNTGQLLRQIAQLNERTFLYWGADSQGDVFTGYTFTLESGFPDEAIRIVLASIKNSDQFVGEMRPAIDGSSAAP